MNVLSKSELKFATNAISWLSHQLNKEIYSLSKYWDAAKYYGRRLSKLQYKWRESYSAINLTTRISSPSAW